MYTKQRLSLYYPTREKNETIREKHEASRRIPLIFVTSRETTLIVVRSLYMTENELATIAVNICFKIHTTMGPGLLESVYEAAFAYELEQRNIIYTRQQGIAANYNEIVLDVGN